MSVRGCTGRFGLFGAADEDADGFVVLVAAEDVVDEGDEKLSLPAYSGWNLPVFEFDDDVSGLFDVEEEQVDVEVVTVDVEVDLAADECEARAEFAEGFRDSAGKGVFEFSFSDFAGEAEEFEVVGVLGDLLGEL